MVNNNKRKKVLVLTDRFPPYSEGGAEISLSVVITKLIEYGYEFCVITFSDQIDAVERKHFKNVPVYSVPYSSQWSNPTGKVGKLAKRRPAFLFERIHRVVDYLWYLSKAIKKRDLALRLRKIWLFHSLANRGLLRYFPLIDEDIADAPRTKSIIRDIFREFQPDIVHADNFRSILLSRELFANVPLVHQVRDNRFYCANRAQPMNINGVICSSCDFGCVNLAQENYIELIKELMGRDLAFRQESLRRSNQVIVTSRFLERQVGTFLPKDRVSVVTNPADDELTGVRVSQDKTFPPEILIVGMINENKGQLRILKWMDILESSLVDYRIVIAGRGDRLRAVMEKRLHETRTADRVMFTGYLSRTELRRAYARATVVACPNTWPEPFGRVPLEAGLARKPIVAFAVGGISENIVHGETGCLVPENDDVAFAETLVGLIADPEKAQYLGDNAARFVRDHYAVEKTASQLICAWDAAAR